MQANLPHAAAPRRTPPFEWFARSYLMASLGLAANVTILGLPVLSPLFMLIWASFYALTLAFLLNLIIHDGIPMRSWLAILAAFLPAISPIWSELPRQSLVQGVGLAANLMFAVVMARRMSLPQIVAAGRWALNAMLLLSLGAVVLGYPAAFYNDALARQSIVGLPPIQGMFTHKIFLGVYSAIALGINLATLRGRSRTLMVGVAFLCVLASGSSTSLAAAAVVMLIYIAVVSAQKTRIGGAIVVPLFFFMACLALIGITNYQEILLALGRDETLTGRTELWRWAIMFFEQKPMFGWGYGGIFNDAGPGPSDIFFNGFYRAPHFHSGYLQVLAEMGVVGFALTMVVLSSVAVRAYRATFLTFAPERMALLIFIGTLIPVYFAMNILMRYNDFSTIILIAAYLVEPNRRGRGKTVAQVQPDAQLAQTARL